MQFNFGIGVCTVGHFAHLYTWRPIECKTKVCSYPANIKVDSNTPVLQRNNASVVWPSPDDYDKVRRRRREKLRRFASGRNVNGSRLAARALRGALRNAESEVHVSASRKHDHAAQMT